MNKPEQVELEYERAKEKRRVVKEHSPLPWGYHMMWTLMTQNQMTTAALQGNSKHDKMAHENCKGVVSPQHQIIFLFSSYNKRLTPGFGCVPKRLGN